MRRHELSEALHCQYDVAMLYWLAEALGAEDRPDRNAGPIDVTPMMPGILPDLQDRV